MKVAARCKDRLYVLCDSFAGSHEYRCLKDEGHKGKWHKWGNGESHGTVKVKWRDHAS